MSACHLGLKVSSSPLSRLRYSTPSFCRIGLQPMVLPVSWQTVLSLVLHLPELAYWPALKKKGYS